MQIHSVMKKQLFLLFVAIFLNQGIYAQAFTEQTGIILPGVSHSSSCWGDYNKDGNLDILVSGYTGEGFLTKVFKSNGDNTFTEQTGINLPGVWYCSTVWGDYNNDGFPDILITGAMESDTSFISRVYKNDGNGNFEEQTNIVLPGINWTSSVWGDFNNDGYLDILLSGYTGTDYLTKIYQNNQDNSFTELTSAILPGLYGVKVACADYNNDGCLDILLTGLDSTWISRIFKNNCDGTFTAQTTIPMQGVYDAGTAWGDYNNDGYLDLIISGDYRNAAGSVAYSANIYKNNGNNTFTALQGIPLQGTEYGSVAWGDYDNDGDLDFIQTGSNYFNGANPFISKIYRNDGNDQFTEQSSISITPAGHSNVDWGDYDNDGDLDLLISGVITNSYPYLYITKVYRNNSIIANSPASSPQNLQTEVNGSDVTFKWDKASDPETPQDGLSYNLYVYREGETTFKRPPHAFTQTQPANGCRLISAIGNIQYNENGYTLHGFTGSNYKWSVQAVDAGLKGGPFAVEKTIIAASVTSPPITCEISISPNPAHDKIMVELTGNTQNAYPTLSISDRMGKILYQDNLFQTRSVVDISRLTSGMYFLKVEGKNGLTVRKLVKQ